MHTVIFTPRVFTPSHARGHRTLLLDGKWKKADVRRNIKEGQEGGFFQFFLIIQVFFLK